MLEDLYIWRRAVGLIENRVKALNFITGNHATICYERGRYWLSFYGCELASWDVYDVPSAERAYQRIDAVTDGLWYAFRGGALVP